jgi:hypothetical protein
MITKLMEDTCLKDMQATRLSSLKTEKHLQVHRLPKALRSMEWTSSSSGIHCSTLPFLSSLKIFTILTSIGASAPTSTRRPSLSQPKRATSVQSADTMSFRTITWIRHVLCVLKKLKNGAKNILRNNNTPAAHRVAGHFPPFQAASYKLRNFSYMDSSDKQQASSFKPQATSCKQREPS